MKVRVSFGSGKAISCLGLILTVCGRGGEVDLYRARRTHALLQRRKFLQKDWAVSALEPIRPRRPLEREETPA